MVVEALRAQAGKLINCSPAYYNERMARLAALLAEASGVDQVFLCNSGAEANEGAIKLARKWGQRFRGGAYEIVTTQRLPRPHAGHHVGRRASRPWSRSSSPRCRGSARCR